jgi:hypothetical protein
MFWIDRWIGECALYSVFPLLYSITQPTNFSI